MGRIKGLNNREAHMQASTLIDTLNLEAYVRNKSDTLSGGNKRKLCTAMSLISHPQIMFLDEPTTGLDPISRRRVWKTLKTLNRTIIYTTHRHILYIYIYIYGYVD